MVWKTLWWRYKNWQTSWEEKWRGGKEEGLYTRWYENGQKLREETYRDGKLDGLQTQWYENGQKSQEATYLNSTETSVTEWDENGNQTSP